MTDYKLSKTAQEIDAHLNPIIASVNDNAFALNTIEEQEVDGSSNWHHIIWNNKLTLPKAGIYLVEFDINLLVSYAYSDSKFINSEMLYSDSSLAMNSIFTADSLTKNGYGYSLHDCTLVKIDVDNDYLRLNIGVVNLAGTLSLKKFVAVRVA